MKNIIYFLIIVLGLSYFTLGLMTFDNPLNLPLWIILMMNIFWAGMLAPVLIKEE